MHRFSIGLGVALATLGVAPAQAQPTPPRVPAHPGSMVARQSPNLAAPKSPAPKLLVAIAVDQFSADLFAQYRRHYTGGFVRLMDGAVFPSAFQSHSATETCPGHSTILTGVHPSRSGIIANNWYDFSIKRADKRVYCAENETDPNSASKTPVVSAVHLRVPTLGERMKGIWPTSRNVAVSAKDRAVMMMGGHAIDAAYWWQGQGFGTVSGGTSSAAALAENTAILAILRRGAPAFVPPDYCAVRSRAVPIGPTGDLVVGTGRFALAPDTPDDFRVSPRMDVATLDLAARLVTEMHLGQGPVPDMLSISLSATDYVGHAYGTQGSEMCIQQAEMDRALGGFFARLDAMGIDYGVVLTADHGGLDVPERLDQQAVPTATRADISLTPGALSKAVAAELGLSTDQQIIFSESAFGDYYVTTDLPPAVRARAIAALAARLRASPQVERVWLKPELAALPIPTANPQDWTLADRARASWDADRSGDVFDMLRRDVVPIPTPARNYTATHGSPWDYDRRVPLLFWRRGVPGMEQAVPVETVDIAPTLASWIGLSVPAGAFDGRCLDVDGGPRDSCEGPASVPSGR